MYKVMPKKDQIIVIKLNIQEIYHSKKAFIEEVTSKTSESESAGWTGKLNTSLIKVSAFGQLD